MPLSGTLDVSPLLANAPRIDDLHIEPWQTPGCELLHLKFEIDDASIVDVLPRALHPSIPPTAIFTVARYPESPVGPFMLAQVRIGCRASALPRGYLTRAYTDTAAAAEALSSRWGYNCAVGEVWLSRYYDRIVGTVTDGGREVLRATLRDPEPISGGDIQYVANMHLARVPDDEGRGALVHRGALVQVDPSYVFHKAERGPPEVEFDRVAWAAERVDPVWPIAASFAICDTGFPKLRYLLDPDQPAITGTRTVAP